MKIYFITLLFIPFISFGQTDSIANARITYTSENPVYSILLYIEKGDSCIYNKAFGNLGKGLQPASENNQFRIASSTKLFISTIILQLIEEGKLTLKDKAFQYLKNIGYLDFENFHLLKGRKWARQITVEQLLSHRTGLADIFTDKEQSFFNLLLQNPKKQYTPQSIVALYYQYKLNQQPHFAPDQGWHYSDMNYVLLGLIIASIEQQELHVSIRNRILVPLQMKDTYFEFYEKPLSMGSLVNQYIGDVNFSDLNTSFDWAGGGLVSTNQDLSIFIKALFEHRLINSESLKKMINVRFTQAGENRYGLGIYESAYNGQIFFGHYGFYGTYIGYCPENKTIISYSISQATPGFNVHNFISKVLEQKDKNWGKRCIIDSDN